MVFCCRVFATPATPLRGVCLRWYFVAVCLLPPEGESNGWCFVVVCLLPSLGIVFLVCVYFCFLVFKKTRSISTPRFRLVKTKNVS
jgi:hypothetical protein